MSSVNDVIVAQSPMNIPKGSPKFLLQDISRTLHCCRVSVQRPYLRTHRAPHWNESGDGGAQLNGAAPKWSIHINGLLFCHLLDACLADVAARRRFVHALRQQQRPLVLFVMQPTRLEYIDYKWNDINAHNAYTQLELEHLTSWLSTLGGGYSALGDTIDTCSDIALRISIYQFKLAAHFESDPSHLERSKLYLAIAMIQKQQLRLAKHTVRTVFQAARAEHDVDTKLVNMCYGIWMRLQYCYAQRALRRRNEAIH